MTSEAVIENGTAKIEAGTWLVGRAQPAAFFGMVKLSGLKGFIVPDRASVKVAATTATAWCADAEKPFLVRLSALPDESLNVVSAKLLVAPAKARVGARNLKLVPFSFLGTTAVTQLRQGWAVLATRSRVTRIALGEDETLTVRPEALVAWVGKDPTGFCPRLTLLDMLLPRGPRNLSYSFHGPAVVWFEGSVEQSLRRRMPNGVRA